MKNNASIAYSFFLVIGDFLALVSAFVTAYILRVSIDTRPLVAEITSRQYLRAFVVLLPFWLIIFGLLGLYNKRVFGNRFSEFGRLCIGSFLGILFVISYSYMTDTPIFPARLVTVYGFALALCFLLLFRTIARMVRRWLFSYGYGVSNVLLVGSTPITAELISSLSDTNITGYKVVGVVSESKKALKEKFKDLPVYESFERATKAFRKESLHSIIQTQLYSEAERNDEILTYAQQNHISYRFAPGNSELFVGNIDVDLFQSMPLIAVHQTALIGWGRIAKRLFDLVVGGFLFLITLPILILASIAILLFDFGPVMFRQVRLSRFNRKVKIFKLRTHKRAYNGLSPEEAFTKMGKPELIKEYRDHADFLPNDPRISKVGHFLRKTKIDELPQLINVVKGDISLIGPRAIVPMEMEQSSKKNLILSVKSGLTGLAQISGRDDLSFDERRKLDLYYVQNWTFWGDVVILARTVSVVLFHRGVR